MGASVEPRAGVFVGSTSTFLGILSVMSQKALGFKGRLCFFFIYLIFLLILLFVYYFVIYLFNLFIY